MCVTSVATDQRRAFKLCDTAAIPSVADTPAAAQVGSCIWGSADFHRDHPAWYTAHTPDAAQ